MDLNTGYIVNKRSNKNEYKVQVIIVDICTNLYTCVHYAGANNKSRNVENEE